MPGKSIRVLLEWQGATETDKGSIGIVNIKMGSFNYTFKPQNYLDGKPDILTIADTDLLESLALNAVIFPRTPSAEPSSSVAPNSSSFKQSLWNDTLKRPAQRGLTTSFQLVEIQTSSEQVKIALPTSYIEGETYKLAIKNEGSLPLSATLGLMEPAQELKPITIKCAWQGSSKFLGDEITLVELGLSTKLYKLRPSEINPEEPQFLQIDTGNRKVGGLTLKNTDFLNAMSLKAVTFTIYDDTRVSIMDEGGIIRHPKRARREDYDIKCILPATFTPGETYELIITKSDEYPWLSAKLALSTPLNREALQVNREVLQAINNIFKGLLITKLVEMEMKLKPQLAFSIFASLVQPNPKHIAMIEQKLAVMVKGLDAVDINKLAVLIKEKDEMGFASYFMLHGGKEKIAALAKDLFKTIHPSAEEVLIQQTCERFMDIVEKHLSPKLSEASHQ